MKKTVFTIGTILLTFLSGIKAQDKRPLDDGHVITEIVTKDSVSAKDLLDRAIAWAQKETPKYEKINPVGGGSKVEMDVAFPIKPKELNPSFNYTGKILMHVTIETKFGKYKYTIKKINHTASNGKNTGGDITKEIAECGSMLLPELTWKKIKGESLKDANTLAEEIKDAMSTPVNKKGEDW